MTCPIDSVQGLTGHIEGNCYNQFPAQVGSGEGCVWLELGVEGTLEKS